MTTHDEPTTREEREKVLDELSALDQELGLDKMSNGPDQHQSIDNTKINDMPLTTELTKLWEISDNGKAEWWPDEVRPVLPIGCNYCFTPNGHPEHDIGPGPWYRIKKKHALHIVKGHAEEWLRGRGWDIFKFNDGTAHYRLYDAQGRKMVPSCNSLHEAILAEVGRE
jgi:hypothetical protein